MSDQAWSLYAKAFDRNMALSEALGAAIGHMRNALTDLDTGTKADARRTLIAGIKIAEAPFEAIKAQIEADRKATTPGAVA